MPLKLIKTNPQMVDNQLVSAKEAASILSVSISTLNNDRWSASKEGVSPKVTYIRLPTGGIRYRLADLRALIEACVVS